MMPGRILSVCALAVTVGLAASAAEPELLNVKRIHVETLSGGETANQIRDMIISSIQQTGLFRLTENPEQADAILRGSAEDLIYNESHDMREGVDARGSLSVGRSRSNTGSPGFTVNSSAGEDSAVSSVERRHEAVAALRLVTPDGEIIWSTVQESNGAKLRSASVDVAERVGEQLAKDYKRLQDESSSSPPE